MANIAACLSHRTDDWGTPQALFDSLHAEFSFDVDVAADTHKAKCALWFGPGSEIAENSLDTDWCGLTCWMNPPYSNVWGFLAKAAEEASKGATVVSLIPSRTDTKAWHTYVWDERTHSTRPGVSIRFVKGRLKFVSANPIRLGSDRNCAPFPSVLIVMRPVQ